MIRRQVGGPGWGAETAIFIILLGQRGGMLAVTDVGVNPYHTHSSGPCIVNIPQVVCIIMAITHSHEATEAQMKSCP